MSTTAMKIVVNPRDDAVMTTLRCTIQRIHSVAHEKSKLYMPLLLTTNVVVFLEL